MCYGDDVLTRAITESQAIDVAFEDVHESQFDSFDLLLEDSPEFEEELEHVRVLAMAARYKTASETEVGEWMECPACGKSVQKTSHQHIFCSNRGAGNCKDTYYNFTNITRRAKNA